LHAALNKRDSLLTDGIGTQLVVRTIVLKNQGFRILIPTSPFDFDGTVFRPDHFPSKDGEWEPGVYWQTLRWNGENFGVRLQDLGTHKRPRIKANVFAKQKPSPSTFQEILSEVRWRFDLDSAGVPRFVDRFRKDQYLGPAIRHHPGMRLKSGYSLYEYLVITVMLQNTVVRRSVSMLQALFERYGQKVSFDGHSLWAFWDPEKIRMTSEEELRALKLGYRAKTLKRQAEQFVKGRINDSDLRRVRNSKKLAETLDDIYGVGAQSAWYMATEFFHFYDSLDYISPWEGEIVGRILFGRKVSTRKVQEFLTNRYGEFRSLAFAYLFIDLFWQHRETLVQWLSQVIRL
jgi:3-methyladenine DNA glycosylase/8-oxoguanine DNA glycosylase